MTPRSIQSTADVTVTITAALEHRCPFVDEIDQGAISITWRCNGTTLELHSLREYLHCFKDSEVSHEALTDLIRHDLSAIPGVDLISVDSTWQTAGIEVMCSTSPIHVGRP